MKKIYERGFSLIELLVVLGIIAILTSLTTYNFNQARQRARDVQRKNDLKQIQTALEMYKNDNSQSFPATYNLLVAAGLIPSWPSDPKQAMSSGSWVDYAYTYNSATSYTLTTCLETVTDLSASATTCGPAGRATAGRVYTVTNP